MPRHAFSLTVRTFSRGIGIRYVHLPPRVLPVSVPQSRRARVMPITPAVLQHMNTRRTYCDDLSGNSSFSGNWANDFDDGDDSTSSPASQTSSSSFWRRLSEYSSAYREPQTKKEVTTTSTSRSSFSDEDIEMINKTAAVTAAATSVSSPKTRFATNISEDSSHIIQKTVGEITKGIKFPDPDVWADISPSANSTSNYMPDFATSESAVPATIARELRTASRRPAKGA
ncbi:hypothetical protein TWF718_005039 [Orbilia javanica]|uniref:Uncharacterized protein n=1 Tax=Orbilia javanica TaxID=47235 RepID=A0AAN8RG02_9PEZI